MKPSWWFRRHSVWRQWECCLVGQGNCSPSLYFGCRRRSLPSHYLDLHVQMSVEQIVPRLLLRIKEVDSQGRFRGVQSCLWGSFLVVLEMFQEAFRRCSVTFQGVCSVSGGFRYALANLGSFRGVSVPLRVFQVISENVMIKSLRFQRCFRKFRRVHFFSDMQMCRL